MSDYWEDPDFSVSAAEDDDMKLSAQKRVGVLIDASADFLETSFVVRSKNSFVWRNVAMEINYSDSGDGFVYKAAEIIPKRSYTIGLKEFVDRDGTRYSSMPRSVTSRPQNIVVKCNTPAGNGLWAGVFV